MPRRGVTGRPMLRAAALALVMALVAGCDSPGPTLAPAVTTGAATPLPSAATSTPPTAAPPTAAPSPTAAARISVPLAVVTGLTNLKAVIALDELAALADAGELIVPCGVEVKHPLLGSSPSCVPADLIARTIEDDQDRIALLPPGLVQPATKVLAIAGDGPYGLFGPDLFGAPESRALPYPVTGSTNPDEGASFDPAWAAYEPGDVWTLSLIGSLCADRSAARQAVTLGKGWDWVFDGGTAKYKGPPIPNPNPPPGIDRHPIVKPVETGNDGLTANLIRRADVTLGNQKCPIMPTKDWKPSNQAGGLSIPEAAVERWADFLGVDAVYLAADHQSDRGVKGIRSTLQILDKRGFPHTGLGLNLAGALAPAFLEVAGTRVAFVSWNDVPGPVHASATTPGVAWLNKANVEASVKLARDGGADLVICDPQWWGGGSEYRPYLRASQKKQVGWMDGAGCDQIFAGGLHVAGGVFIRESANGVRVVDAGPGNYQYGQDFWQDTQEGVVIEATFRGATLVNLRLHPYVMILAARAALLDPEGDGHYVLERIWKNSEVAYLP